MGTLIFVVSCSAVRIKLGTSKLMSGACSEGYLVGNVPSDFEVWLTLCKPLNLVVIKKLIIIKGLSANN